MVHHTGILQVIFLCSGSLIHWFYCSVVHHSKKSLPKKVRDCLESSDGKESGPATHTTPLLSECHCQQHFSWPLLSIAIIMQV